VWLEWTSPKTGVATVNSTAPPSCSVISFIAYPGDACPPTAGSALACGQGEAGGPCFPDPGGMSFAVVSGETYLIQIGNDAFPVADGSIEITVACNPCDPGVTFCPGDDTGPVSCPCGNPSTNGGGCANSSGNGGALDAEGNPSLSADTLVLKSTNLIPNQPCLFFQGNNAINGGNGIAFGDGLRCAGNSVVRLQIGVPDAGGATQTSLSISVKGGCSPGDVKRYQNWYRDPVSSPCSSTFNLTNGYQALWLP